MSTSPERRLAAGLLALGLAAGLAAHGTARAQPYPGIGRAATPAELKAWDIDVRPDFRGLPKGSGSVARGQDVWEAKCASCHGIFGESNEVFAPIVGGTTKDDIRRGRVARLTDPSFPGRTTLMKLSNVSTLWDYINRAMPWNQPKSLSVEEVYAVTAYILNMGGIVPDDFTLSDANIREVQRRLPNRDGMTTDHAMWPGAGFGTRRPDVAATACTKDCGPEPAVASFLPDFARNAHGNLAEQNRAFGPQRGVDTTRPAPASLADAAGAARTGAAAAAPAARPAAEVSAYALAQKHACTACHGLDSKLVGPSFADVAKRHGARADAVDYLATRIKAGGSGVWGAIPMPPQSLGDADAKAIAQWLASGARR
ncbi:MAG TPA: c-type cytochrome [Burkholderiaceae bacterium]|nr:c-type cytochrome [Burkholderiaceae bacterium]